MMHNRKATTAAATLRERVIQRFIEKYGQLTPEHQQIVDDEIGRMLARREDEPA